MVKMSDEAVRAHEARLAAQKGQDKLPGIDQELKDETELQDQIAQYLRLKEIPFFRQRMDKRTTGTVGWPDFSYVFQGKACFIECKMPGKDLSDEQRDIQLQLVAAGAHYRIVRSLPEAVEAVHEAEAL